MSFASQFEGNVPIDHPGAHLHAHLDSSSVSSAHVLSGAIIVPDAHLLFTGRIFYTGPLPSPGG